MNTDSAHETAHALDRRSFLRSITGSTALAAAAGGVGSTPSAAAAEIGPVNAQQRRNTAFNVRHRAAVAQKSMTLPPHPTSADDNIYPNFIGSFTKTLPHNTLGEVVPSAYHALRQALASGQQAALNAVPLGGVTKLTNPQAAYAYQLEGADSHHLGMPAAPALSSAWCAAEMTEVYWRAWTRDIAFIDYDTHPHIAAAAADLNALSDYRGPRTASGVTAGTIFRGVTPGDLTGPFISQFLYLDIPFGGTPMPQRYRTIMAGDNHMTSYSDWLAVQNGAAPPRAALFDPTHRYISTGRDLAEFVHNDFSFQAYQSAALILLGFGAAAIDDNNPYKHYANQNSFVTFGGPMVLDLVARAAMSAFKAAWYQKWLVHRRLRPEAYGGLVHHKINGSANYPLHPDALNSAVLPLIQGAYGTSLLPMAFPEGCPTHPAYPAGHATIAGACVTVLKAFFKESYTIPNPVQSNADGLSLMPFNGPLTVGGELNKLAANISHGRDTAGVHWRTDGIDGMLLGEEVAIRLLRECRGLNNESFAGFSLTKFDGSTVLV